MHIYAKSCKIHEVCGRDIRVRARAWLDFSLSEIYSENLRKNERPFRNAKRFAFIKKKKTDRINDKAM